MFLRSLIYAGIVFDINHHINLTHEQYIWVVAAGGMALILDVLTGRN